MGNMIDEIMNYNKSFVEDKGYEKYITSKFPDKKVAIVTCMDTRLTELLPAALGLKNGDAKFIKTAGGVISHPFGSVMRSLLIGIYDLDIKEIFVVGHTDCGACHTDGDKMIKKMREHGITQDKINLIKYCGVDYNSWLNGFINLNDSVKKSVELVVEHPLVPKDINVYGMIIDSVTGELNRIV